MTLAARWATLMLSAMARARQPDQGFADVYVELHRDHPRRLVDLGPVGGGIA